MRYGAGPALGRAAQRSKIAHTGPGSMSVGWGERRGGRLCRAHPSTALPRGQWCRRRCPPGERSPTRSIGRQSADIVRGRSGEPRPRRSRPPQPPPPAPCCRGNHFIATVSGHTYPAPMPIPVRHPMPTSMRGKRPPENEATRYPAAKRRAPIPAVTRGPTACRSRPAGTIATVKTAIVTPKINPL